MSKEFIVNGEPRLAYSVNEVLRMVPFGRNTLYDEAKAGRLPLRKLGRSTLVLADELRAYLQALPLMFAPPHSA